MARQTGLVYYTGTRNGVTYYKLFGGQYYVRSKSSLTGKRFHSDPAFEGARRCSKNFGCAATLASAINKLLPKQRRGRGFMGKLIGQVHQALLQGKPADEIQRAILIHYGVSMLPQQPKEITIAPDHLDDTAAKALRSFWVVGDSGRLAQGKPDKDAHQGLVLFTSVRACNACFPPG